MSNQTITITLTDDDWRKCKRRFDAIYRQYCGLIGVPGVNVAFALNCVLDPLLFRYNEGERTQSLYDEMWEVR